MGDQRKARSKSAGKPVFDRERIILALVGLAGAAVIFAANMH